MLLIVEFRHEWVRGGVRIFLRTTSTERGVRPRGAQRVAALARAPTIFFTAARIFPAVFSGLPMTAVPVPQKTRFVRACLHDVENHPAIGVVAHVGVRARRAGPHAVGAVAVRFRLERNQRRSLSQ